MLNFTVQKRSGKMDVFGVFTGEKDDPTLRTKPATFELGDRTTDPEKALITLSEKEARSLAAALTRAAGKEGS